MTTKKPSPLLRLIMTPRLCYALASVVAHNRCLRHIVAVCESVDYIRGLPKVTHFELSVVAADVRRAVGV